MKMRLVVSVFAAAVAAAWAQDKSAVDAFAEAIALRENLTAALVQGDETPAAVLTRLRAQASPSGLKVDREADFALAAIDVGQRLLAAGRADAAEEFFLAAEKSLLLAIGKTKDEAAPEKALYLQRLAFIRANFLNETDAAVDDLDAAIRLQPEDKNLRDMKTNQAREKAEQAGNKAKN